MVRLLRLIAALAASAVIAGCGGTSSSSTGTGTGSGTGTGTGTTTESLATAAFDRAKSECRYIHQTTNWSLTKAISSVKAESVSSVQDAVANGCTEGYGP